MLSYLCSRDDRVTRLDWDGQSWAAHPVLDGVSASCVATDGERVLVGIQGDGARLSLDGGGSWEPIDLPERDVLSVAISEADGALYAGPSRATCSSQGTAVPGPSSRRCRRSLEGSVELPPTAVDSPRPLDRARSPRP